MISEFIEENLVLVEASQNLETFVLKKMEEKSKKDKYSK